MNWHLNFNFPPLERQAGFTDKVLMTGSCFAESIGGYLTNFKFNTVINPHGILYNPVSILTSLKAYINNKEYKESDLFFDHGLWHSWDHHERFSHSDKNVCLTHINTAIKNAHLQLMNADWLIITLGTSGAYRLNRSGEIVGNCHKLPGSEFDFLMLDPDEIVSSFENFFTELFELNSNIKVILTVSPVRYLKYGLINNNLSKSALLYSVHQLIKRNVRIFYFPAYEIVIDELRDYRFYTDDLSHPNLLATEYVWEKFKNYFLSRDTREILDIVKPIIHASGHRPLHSDSPEFRSFVKAQLNKIAELEKRYPFLNFEKEKDTFRFLK